MLTHGGDLVGFAHRYGTFPLDFSVNTNPFGLSPLAKAALEQAFEHACEYPDPLYRELRRAIAEHEEVPMEWLCCSNGAADLIWRIGYAVRPQSALVCAPTFSEYETALKAVGCQVEHYILTASGGFETDPGILDLITNDTDILFLCNPNNPTGLTIKRPLLQDILNRCRDCGTLLVADECFLGFLPDAAQLSLKSQLTHYPNLLILKAFTKLYGMAGLRLGYCICSDTALLSSLAKAGQCWPVSVAAEKAGIAALGDHDFVAKTLAFLPNERKRVLSAMEQMGLLVYPSQANYLFFYTDIDNYHERLADHGILIRNCSNYAGLSKGYYRTAILTNEKNNRLLAAMEQIKKELT